MLEWLKIIAKFWNANGLVCYGISLIICGWGFFYYLNDLIKGNYKSWVGKFGLYLIVILDFISSIISFLWLCVYFCDKLNLC